MTAGQIRSALRLRPFTVHTAGGEADKATHPETVALSPEGRTVVVLPTGGGVAMLGVDQIGKTVVPSRKPAKGS